MVIDPRFYTLEWLDEEIEAGRMILIESGRAAMLLTKRTYPTGARKLHCMGATGELSDIIEKLTPAAEEIGRSNGCIVGSLESREAWTRLLAPSGYKTYQVCMHKEL